MTPSTASPQHEIAAAEAETSKRIREAEAMMEKELASFRKNAEQEIETVRDELQKEELAARTAEKEELAYLLKEGHRETEKLCSVLREKCSHHGKTLVKTLVDRFLSLTFKA